MKTGWLVGMLLFSLVLAACGNVSVSPTATAEQTADPTLSQAPAGEGSTMPKSPKPSIPVASPTLGPPPSIPVASPTLGPPPSIPVASPDDPRFQACALFTAAELSKVLNADSVQTRPMPSSGWAASQCAWNGPTGAFFVSVGTAGSIKAAGDSAATSAEEKLAQFKAQAGDAAKAVSGIRRRCGPGPERTRCPRRGNLLPGHQPRPHRGPAHRDREPAGGRALRIESSTCIAQRRHGQKASSGLSLATTVPELLPSAANATTRERRKHLAVAGSEGRMR